MKQMRNKRYFLIRTAAWLIVLAGLMSSCSSSDGEEKKTGDAPKKDSAAAPTATFQLERGQLSTDLFVPGELTAFQQVDLYAKVNSFVRKLYVDVGSEVKEGQLLATMEAPELESQLASAESRMKSQEAIYIASKSNYDRIVETSKTPGTISQNDIDQANARQKSDIAQWDAAKAAYKEVGQTLKYLEIRAPFSGVISVRNVNPGAIVGPSGKGSELPIFTLQEQGHLRLVVSVPEALTGYVHDRQEVKFTVKSRPGQKFTATVKRLAGALDSRLRAERTEMDVFPKNKELLPGMVAEVDLPMPARDSTFVVPVSAVVNSTERVFVIRVNGDRQAEWIDVQQGRSQNGKIEVYSNKLKAGDTIVKTGSEELRSGSPVR
jgi:membrane fusion protein (multidrug efflux system)